MLAKIVWATSNSSRLTEYFRILSSQWIFNGCIRYNMIAVEFHLKQTTKKRNTKCLRRFRLLLTGWYFRCLVNYNSINLKQLIHWITRVEALWIYIISWWELCFCYCINKSFDLLWEMKLKQELINFNIKYLKHPFAVSY